MSGIKGEGEQYYGWEGLEPDFSKIPYALCATPQWVLWKAEPKPNGQGMNKIPYQPNGRKAASTRPQEWSTFEECRDAYNEDGADYNGVGFVLSGDDDFIGGDLDHCRDPTTGHLTPDAQKIVNGVETYWEVSPLWHRGQVYRPRQGKNDCRKGSGDLRQRSIFDHDGICHRGSAGACLDSACSHRATP